MRFAQALAAGHQLELGEAVHGVNVVEPLGAILIALVDAVDANEAGAPIRGGSTAFANGNGVARSSASGWLGSRLGGAGCTGAIPRGSRAARSGDRQRAAKRVAAAVSWPAQRGCHAAHRFARAASRQRCRTSWQSLPWGRDSASPRLSRRGRGAPAA